MKFKNEVAFACWCKAVGYDEPAIHLIERIRTSPPSRNVAGGKGNVSARLPSHKMGVTIQSESRTAEKPGIRIFYEYDHLLENPDETRVLEYYDQPDRIVLRYASARGRAVTTWHTPDFFVIREDGAGWEEWKTEPELSHLSLHQPARYQRDEAGQWHCPPGEAYAAKFGLYYRLRSNAEVNWTLFSNLEFLHEYLGATELTSLNRMAVIERVRQQQGMLLVELLEEYPPDEVYLLVALRHLYVNLQHERLVEPAHVHVFSSQSAAEAHQYTTETQFHSLSATASQNLHWRAASEQDYRIANARLQVLRALDAGMSLEQVWQQEEIGSILGTQKSPRTIRGWQKQFRDAQQVSGSGYVGLLPRIHERGNRERKLSNAAWEKLEHYIDQDYETARQPHAASVWAAYRQACECEGIPPASLKTFRKAVKQRPQEIQVYRRQGKRAVHQIQKRYWVLESTTPKHGERIWQIVHLDHTLLDIQLRHAHTGQVLGRPWATFAVDAYSRRLLAVVLTLDDQPSYRTCMLVLREMVSRLGRLPQTLVVDNGKEFHSTYFQALLAHYAVEVAYRPPAQPRFGDVVERLFRTAHTQFIYNLTGNTQLSRHVRLMTASHDPRHLALWTLEALNAALREWAYEVYDQTIHASLGQSPREVYEDSLVQHGERAFQQLDYNAFILQALPAPARGDLRTVQRSGVKIEHIYYWHDLMYRPDILGTQVAVRYDPFNVGVAYAYLDHLWTRCTSEYYATFHNRTEQELQIAREELVASYRARGRDIRTLNARLLADFLERTTTSERLLEAAAVRRRDAVPPVEYDRVRARVHC
ncbi:MAG: DDE-type integrase/transposase/recombinase [Chloroflexi bacterium]|nr:DDE-type integrase/transposase/recombinase [Chloroflexota bacterium]